MIRWKDIARLETYMRFPVPQFTTLLLLAHLGLGCCWHHARVCDAAVDAHRHEVEDGHHGDPHPQHEDGDQHPSCCDGVHCVIARLDHAPDWDGAASMAVAFWVTTASQHEDGQIDPLLHRRLDHCLSNAGPPLRAHLAYQVLLI